MLTVLDHSLIKHKLSIMRQEDTSTYIFKQNLDEIAKNVFMENCRSGSTLEDICLLINKKICEYMVRFSKQEEKRYLPFNIKIYSNDYEVTEKIIEIIKETVKNTNYLLNANINEKSLLKIEKNLLKLWV